MEEDSEFFLEGGVVVVVVHMGVGLVMGELGRGMEKDRYYESVDGGVGALEKDKYDASVEEGLARGEVPHKLTKASRGDDCGGVGCSGGRRAPCMEHGQGRELQSLHASHRCVGFPYDTLPRILRLSPSCTLSHI